MAISDNIKICRIQKNMTQKQLGDLLYVSDKTISKWESGRSIPDIHTIKKIASLLDVEYGLLIDGDQYDNRQNYIWTNIKVFVKNHKQLILSSSILCLWLLLMILVSTKASYFIGMFSFFCFSIYLTLKKSKWYMINILILLISFLTTINNFFTLELNYFVIVLFLLTLILMIIYSVKQRKSNNDILFINFLGNWNIILASFIFMSAYTIKYTGTHNNLELLVDKQSGFILYMFCLISLLFLFQYLLINKDYQHKILNLIKGRLLIASGITILLFVFSLLVSTFVKLTSDHIFPSSVYAYISYYEDPITEDQVNEINNLYGKENVTISRYAEVTTDLQIYAYTSNFIKNGVAANIYTVGPHVEKVSLLYGEVWEENSDKKVIVVDEDTALNSFGKIDVVGEHISINGEQWKIVGVVSNTKAAESYLENAISNGVDPKLVKLDSYVYVPYYFKDYANFEFSLEAEDSYIINTKKIISGNKDAKNLIDILVDGDNYYIRNNGERLTKIGIKTGSDMVNAYISIKVGLLVSSSILVIYIFTSELSIYIGKSKKYDKRHIQKVKAVII